MLYCGKEVKSKADVDKITSERIAAVYGDVDEELKFHRLVLTAFYIQINPMMQGGSRKHEIQETIDKALPKMFEIERIISEGKEFNKANGWK